MVMPSSGPAWPTPDIDTSVPHSARMWNYWLGGKDNYVADQEAAEQFQAAFPQIAENARAFRAFLGRGVTYLAAEAGIRQFVDVGTGLPTENNTHELAQRVAPECRIVYVDNDPLVLAHARALLVGAPEGATDYLHADLHEPETIMRAARQVLDFEQPVALILSGILGHVMDDDEARDLVRRLLAPFPSGSYLLVCDGTDTNEELRSAQQEHNDRTPVQYRLRTPEGIASFFEGLDLITPGVASCTQWRPEPGSPAPHVDSYGAIGRKP
ncbi:SAM-dependent methyltransferase [Streptomyces sp. NPDC058045]|uniref:SAM-dependent methyltransferase n=1 Tax=Streptomyces sp. NPDC058045 TaxID=3346311 RepID=UPI0036EE58AC